LFASATIAPAQETPRVRSHVERFSTLDARAQRAATDANARLAADPNDPEALNLRALTHMRFGRYADAWQDLRRAVAVKPNNSVYQMNLGYVLWKLSRPAEAINAQRAALKLDETNVTAHYQLGRFLLRQPGRESLTEAVVHLRRALELDPRQYEARFELIAAYRAIGDGAQASTQLDLVAEGRPSDPRVFYLRGLIASDRNDLPAAIRGFKEALRRDPSLYGAWQDLGLAYLKLQQFNEALEALGELAKRQPESAEAAYLHALALFNTRRNPEAEAEARRALRLSAGAAEAHTLLGVILAARGNANSEAAESLSQATALNPRSFDAQLYLGRVQYAMRDYEAAQRSLSEATKLNPGHAEARFFLGTVLETLGDSEAAYQQYEQLIKIDPNSAMGLVGAGVLFLKSGKLNEAIDALSRATALDLSRFEAHLALGRALSLAQRLPEAVTSLKKAIALAPNRPDAHYQLGLALRKLGRADEAAAEFAIVEQINRDYRTGAKPKQ
jgi:tetratricopeptide (TPR) repeat protein